MRLWQINVCSCQRIGGKSRPGLSLRQDSLKIPTSGGGLQWGQIQCTTVFANKKYKYSDSLKISNSVSVSNKKDVFLFKVQYAVEHAMAHYVQGSVYSWASSRRALSNFCVNAIHQFAAGLLEEGHRVTTQ